MVSLYVSCVKRAAHSFDVRRAAHKKHAFSVEAELLGQIPRLRWSSGDSTDLHNATQLSYIVYNQEKRDFRQFFARLLCRVP